jgi:hypothetical protein
MSTANARKQAIDLVNSLFPSGASVYWPNVNGAQVKQGLIDRVTDPNMIQQGGANVCGMATFVHSLAADDPVQYVWFAIHLYKIGSGPLGRGKAFRTIYPSKEVRLSKIAWGMDHSDWIVLATLRDHLNKALGYQYDMAVPVLRDIPIFGILGHLLSGSYEAAAGITWPGDLEKALKVVGYSSVINKANTTSLAGYKAMDEASSMLGKGYQVLMLINTAMLGQNSAWQATADHWVKLISPIEENLWAFSNAQGTVKSSGVKFRIFNSAASSATRHNVPIKGGYLPLNIFLNNFYGFVAAKL